LQQSQRDAYDQRKREIAAYIANGGPVDKGGLADEVDIGGFVKRGLVAAVQTEAYSEVEKAYSVKTSSVVE
jgi:hypothetical protein